jgi:transposase
MLALRNHLKIITSVQRRRRWTASEEVRLVEETFTPGMTVRLVARGHGVASNQPLTWRGLVAQGSLTAAGSDEEVVPASNDRGVAEPIPELHRLLCKKTLKAEIRKEALEHVAGSKTAAAAAAAEGRFPMKSVAKVGLALEPGRTQAGTSAESGSAGRRCLRGACGADQGGDRRIADKRMTGTGRDNYAFALPARAGESQRRPANESSRLVV